VANGESETLAIPAAMRREVDERDDGACRFCGRFVGDARALHHIDYGGPSRGMGGRRLHRVDNLMSVGWLFGHDCHSILHGNKRLWQPLALEAVKSPGLTVLQLYRWRKRHG
jgi:5-methylcytosine-specific restriction endonuclease McrA